MGNIKDIVDVAISIESPVSSSEAFSHMLVIGPKATGATELEMPDVLKISSENDLTAYGYQTTDAAYKAAYIAFEQNPAPSEIYVAVRKDASSDTPEEITVTLDRCNTSAEFYGFVLAGYNGTTDLQNAAKWAQTNNKLFGFTWTGESRPFDTAEMDHVFDCCIENSDSEYLAAAWMTKCFTYEPGSETWGLKTLVGIPASTFASGKVNTLKAANSNFYSRYVDRNIMQEGKVGTGEWIDIIRLKDFLLSEIQIRVFAYLTSNPKVAYNDGGITGVQNVIESVLSASQRTGGIDADIFDDNGNVERGYKVIVPKAADIDKATRKTRRLKNVIFTARLAGAIHNVTIRGTLTY